MRFDCVVKLELVGRLRVGWFDDKTQPDLRRPN